MAMLAHSGQVVFLNVSIGDEISCYAGFFVGASDAHSFAAPSVSQCENRRSIRAWYDGDQFSRGNNTHKPSMSTPT